MNERQQDIWVRAVRTFWQAMLAHLLADTTVLSEALSGWSRGRQLLLTLFVGAVAAGLSAVYNGVVRPLLEGGHEG